MELLYYSLQNFTICFECHHDLRRDLFNNEYEIHTIVPSIRISYMMEEICMLIRPPPNVVSRPFRGGMEKHEWGASLIGAHVMALIACSIATLSKSFGILRTMLS